MEMIGQMHQVRPLECPSSSLPPVSHHVSLILLHSFQDT